MTYHTALDVSLRSVSICIVDDEGTIHFEGKAASEVNRDCRLPEAASVRLSIQSVLKPGRSPSTSPMACKPPAMKSFAWKPGR